MPGINVWIKRKRNHVPETNKTPAGATHNHLFRQIDPGLPNGLDSPESHFLFKSDADSAMIMSETKSDRPKNVIMHN